MDPPFHTREGLGSGLPAPVVNTSLINIEALGENPVLDSEWLVSIRVWPHLHRALVSLGGERGRDLSTYAQQIE